MALNVSDEEKRFNNYDTFRSMTSGLPLSWVAPPPPAGILNITTKLRTMQSQRPNQSFLKEIQREKDKAEIHHIIY